MDKPSACNTPLEIVMSEHHDDGEGLDRFKLAQSLQEALFAHPQAGPIPVSASLLTLVMEMLRKPDIHAQAMYQLARDCGWDSFSSRPPVSFISDRFAVQSETLPLCKICGAQHGKIDDVEYDCPHHPSAPQSAGVARSAPVAWWLTGDKRHEDCLFFSEKWARDTYAARMTLTPDATLRVEPLSVVQSATGARDNTDILRAIVAGYMVWEALGDPSNMVKAINEAEVRVQEANATDSRISKCSEGEK